ncbi:alpha/beta hydrolase [uncultured Tateyamaria sp.]|uniref:alpha/beta fold hydrolase n=1 Tax=uncultured Tateyamaria sp. TaxID=455651 RepID=UPI0026365043|nr:alpha/beta hydrolase [uncultured Tateyamaria sp.]
MRIEVNGVRLYVDIEGSSLVPDGPEMREKPTLIALHGGPGSDHSIYKPHLGQLADMCQIIYVDHRGNGRSDDGDPSTWTLAQWGDDIAGLCDVLGLDAPIIYGASFGGYVAQSFATRHPDRLSGLILSVTAAHVDFETVFAAFARIGGPKAGAVARTYWSDPTPDRRQAYFDTCFPLYSVRGLDQDMVARMIVKNPVAMQFNGPKNEHGRFDFRADLARVTCPALVIAGDRDPIMPHVFGAEIARHLPDPRFHLLENAGHTVDFDAPEAFYTLMRDFINEVSDAA